MDSNRENEKNGQYIGVIANFLFKSQNLLNKNAMHIFLYYFVYINVSSIYS